MPDKRVLTDRALRALKPPAPGQRTTIWDASAPGLCIRVTDKGKISFYYIGRARGDRRLVNHRIGAYPAMALGDARQAAREVMAVLAAGQRPKEAEAERRREEQLRRGETFAAVAENFLKRHAASLRSGEGYASVVRRDLLPALGEVPIADVTRRDVVRVIEQIIDERGRFAARHAFAVLRKLLNWAAERGDIEVSPAAGLKAASLHGSVQSRDRVLSDEELRRVWRAAGRAGYPMGPLVRLLMLTGQRRDEVADLRWSEIDLDAALLTLPAERMKNKRPHTVPLTPAACAILADLPRFVGPHALTTTGGRRPISGFSKMKPRLDKLVGEMPRWTLHDLRRTVRTRLSALGVSPVVAELVIAHAQTGIAAVYDLHRYDAEKRDALTRWEAALLSIVGDEPAGGANVVPIRAAAG